MKQGFLFYSNTRNVVAELQEWKDAAKAAGCEVDFALPAKDLYGKNLDDRSCAVYVMGTREQIVSLGEEIGRVYHRQFPFFRH